MNGESVVKICTDESMPARSTLHKWLSENDEFSDRYAQSLQHRTHLKAEERHDIISRAMNKLEDLPENVNGNVFASLIKEQVRAIEWDAERLAAKKYKPKDEQDIKITAAPTIEIVRATKDMASN